MRTHRQVPYKDGRGGEVARFLTPPASPVRRKRHVTEMDGHFCPIPTLTNPLRPHSGRTASESIRNDPVMEQTL